MQPCSGGIQGVMASITSYVSSPQISLQELQNGQQQQQQQQQISNPPVLQNGQQQQQQQQQQIPNPPVDDFLEQMLSNLPWNEISGASKSPWELNPYTLNPNNNNNNNGNNNNQKIFTISLTPPNKSRDFSEDSSPENAQYGYDDSSLLASRLRQHQISSPHNQNSTVVSGNHSPGKSKVLQLNTANVGLHSSQRLVSRGMARSPATSAASCISDNCLLPLPLTLGQGNPDSSDSRLMVDRSREELEASFKSNNRAGETRIQGLYNGFSGSQPRNAQTCNQHFHAQPGSVPTQNYGAPADGKNQPTANGPAGGHIPVRQRVRARRGQATDPHSIAERLRRERIAERMKALQELVPNANKTDKASMLDEIIDYVKFLQLQVKVLSMSRLGGAAAIAPLVADVSSEGGDCIQASGIGRSSNGTQPPSQDSLTVTEHQVAKLMEEDMGSAMQYLQGKGLCLMPISLASAISTATCHSRNHNILLASNVDGPPSPSISVLTVQSAMGNGTDTDVSRSSLKDATSVSKP